jgi:hypothetical protein
MIKSKIFVIIFAFCFVLLMSGQYIRVTQYGLYGSKEMWEKTVIPPEINYPNGTSESDAIIKYGANASQYLIAEREFIDTTKQLEGEGMIKCYPKQNVCHFTGKGVYNYGAYSEFIQSSDYLGWLDLIIKCVIQSIVLSLILTLVIDTGYRVLHKNNK